MPKHPTPFCLCVFTCTPWGWNPSHRKESLPLRCCRNHTRTCNLLLWVVAHFKLTGRWLIDWLVYGLCFVRASVHLMCMYVCRAGWVACDESLLHVLTLFKDGSCISIASLQCRRVRVWIHQQRLWMSEAVLWPNVSVVTVVGWCCCCWLPPWNADYVVLYK